MKYLLMNCIILFSHFESDQLVDLLFKKNKIHNNRSTYINFSKSWKQEINELSSEYSFNVDSSLYNTQDSCEYNGFIHVFRIRHTGFDSFALDCTYAYKKTSSSAFSVYFRVEDSLVFFYGYEQWMHASFN